MRARIFDFLCRCFCGIPAPTTRRNEYGKDLRRILIQICVILIAVTLILAVVGFIL